MLKNNKYNFQNFFYATDGQWWGAFFINYGICGVPTGEKFIYPHKDIFQNKDINIEFEIYKYTNFDAWDEKTKNGSYFEIYMTKAFQNKYLKNVSQEAQFILTDMISFKKVVNNGYIKGS